MEPEFTFTYHENTPCDGVTTFRASFAEVMSNTPSTRPAYAGIVARVAQWCEERFGPPGHKMTWGYSKMGIFHFEDQQGAFEFRLNWC